MVVAAYKTNQNGLWFKVLSYKYGMKPL